MRALTMTQIEANKIIDRLMNGCNYHRFDEPGVQFEYQKALMRYGFDQMNTAVDVILENDSKNVPPISALVRAMRENKTGTMEVKNADYCEVCDNKGYVMVTEIIKNGDKDENDYQYPAYCPFCTIGRSQAYVGKNNKEYKTDYVCPPLTKYFDDNAIDLMRLANREKKTNVTKGKMPQFGRDMPELKPWDKRSDADDSEFYR
jgi:hypothetical protein